MANPSDSYVVDKQIGKGAYGVAYTAKHKVTGTKCVLKKVKLARQSHKERQASLMELLILSNLRHRNVLTYLDAWVEAGCTSCMVVELCENGDLMSQLRIRVQSQVYFHEKHLQEMLVQLASGLSYLHRNNIAHRDIKSGNVFVSEDGCLKLADFGLATILDSKEPLSSTMVGTPNYMCPEMLKEQPYGVKNDMWALGCVMYELSALKPAFQAFNMDGLVRKITSGPTPLLPTHYSDDWRAMVRSLLSKDDASRPSADVILGLPWLQPAIQSVSTQFGPPLPFGADELVVIRELPAPIARLADLFQKQEMEAEVKAAEKTVHMKEQQAKFAPRALKDRAELEKAEALKVAAAVKAKMVKKAAGGTAVGRAVVPRLAAPVAPKPATSGRSAASSSPRAVQGGGEPGQLLSSPRERTLPCSPRIAGGSNSMAGPPSPKDRKAAGGGSAGSPRGKRAALSADATPASPRGGAGSGRSTVSSAASGSKATVTSRAAPKPAAVAAGPLAPPRKPAVPTRAGMASAWGAAGGSAAPSISKGASARKHSSGAATAAAANGKGPLPRSTSAASVGVGASRVAAAASAGAPQAAAPTHSATAGMTIGRSTIVKSSAPAKPPAASGGDPAGGATTSGTNKVWRKSMPGLVISEYEDDGAAAMHPLCSTFSVPAVSREGDSSGTSGSRPGPPPAASTSTYSTASIRPPLPPPQQPRPHHQGVGSASGRGTVPPQGGAAPPPPASPGSPRKQAWGSSEGSGPMLKPDPIKDTEAGTPQMVVGGVRNATRRVTE